jgi:large subunit ribosomal protein L21
MFAVVKTGGKQYKVQVGSTLNVENLNAEEGAEIILNEVLMVENEGQVVMNPKTEVKALVVSNFRGEKLIAFKKRRRHTYKRKKGHRQYLTKIKVLSIGL